MKLNICVFSSSSDKLNQEYYEVATRLGMLIGEAGHTLVFGAGKVGLMGATARAVHQSGGRVIGVITKVLDEYGVTYQESDELIITQTMQVRKATMEDHSDAFIGLPGGFGTFEELLEVITLKQLGYHNKPIVLINTREFFAQLEVLFENLFEENFAHEAFRSLYKFVETPDEAMTYLKTYQPEKIPGDWKLQSTGD